jgi:hypothetical protein
VFTLLRLLLPIALIVVVAAGSLTLVSRASCRSGGEHGKRETHWSLKLPGSKPEKGCLHRESGLTYMRHQIGL